MTGHPNETLIRRAYTAFGAGDMETFSTIIAPDVVWSVPGDNRLSGEHKGQDAVFALFALCDELTDGTMSVEPLTIAAKGDTEVVSTHRVQARRGERTLDVTETELFTIEDGRVTRVDESVSDEAASDAFWA